MALLGHRSKEYQVRIQNLNTVIITFCYIHSLIEWVDSMSVIIIINIVVSHPLGEIIVKSFLPMQP